MTRPTVFTRPIVALALVSLVWLSSLAPALAATVTDTFLLTLRGTEWCRDNPKFFDTIKVKAKDGVTLTLTRDVLNTGDLTDIQAIINTHGDNATIDAITLNGRAFPVNKVGSPAQLVLSGRDPGNPDHFLTFRGKATFDKAGKLTNVTGTYVYQILSDSGGIPNSDCFGSGTFLTGKKLPPPPGLPDWAQAKLEAYVKASNGCPPACGVQFGFSVALDGDTLAVSAPLEGSGATGVNGNQQDSTGSRSGAVYVFTRSGGVWSQQAYLKASNTGIDDRFGLSVALDGDTLVVGAFEEDSTATGINGNQADNSAQDSGAVYVFTRTGGVWSQQAYLKASNTEAGDLFGWSVALSGDTLAVGANSEDSAATGANGNQADNSTNERGAVYVFTRSGGVWSQQAYVKASNTGAGDSFGHSVALDGDTLAVGANHENGAATGVNGNQADNSAQGAGAIYVFTRTGGVSSQQAYLKASNTGASDVFGFSVALSGDTLVVGAVGEDSAATGVNGNQADNSAQDSGAVYVFTRTGGVWSQQAYVKATNTGASDEFGGGGGVGGKVALAGDTLAVGARGEASAATGVNGNQADNSINQRGAVYVYVRQ